MILLAFVAGGGGVYCCSYRHRHKRHTQSNKVAAMDAMMGLGEPETETEPKVSSFADDALGVACEHGGMSNAECTECARCAGSAQCAECERAFTERLAFTLASPASMRSGSTKTKRSSV